MNHLVGGSPINDVVISWTLFVLLSIGLLVSFVKIGHRSLFLKHENMEHDNIKKNFKKQLTFRKTAMKLKWQILKLILHVFLTFTIFPGVIFSSRPMISYDFHGYIRVIYTAMSIADLAGRFFGIFNFTKVLPNVYSFVQLFVILFFYWTYFSDIIIDHEGLYYVCIVLAAFTGFRNAVSISYYMVRAM